MATRTGKIARRPHALRDEVNRRLLDGQTSRVILGWLNKEPEAVTIWERDFEGVPASAQNLSEWKLGGWKEWRDRKERVENLKTLSSFASELAKAGGSIADGAASILSGQILEALEQAGNLAVTGGSDDAEKDPNDGLAKMAAAIASLQKATVSRGKLELDKKRVKQKDAQLALDRQKFETQSVSKFLEWARSPEAQAILDSGKPKDAILADLRSLMFGSRPPSGKEET
jgi:hypothetical protein